jgi:signal transduction histidine kinase
VSSVWPTGVEMPPEAEHRIAKFAELVSYAPVTLKVGGGSGLRGLLDRVDAVGGRMEVSSARGQGTRICARLPIHVLGSMNGH